MGAVDPTAEPGAEDTDGSADSAPPFGARTGLAAHRRPGPRTGATGPPRRRAGGVRPGYHVTLKALSSTDFSASRTGGAVTTL